MDKSPARRSLEKLASPEQLDRLLVIIRLPGWIALLCILVLILTLTLWSIFGRIAMTANGTGIFFSPEAVELIQSKIDGVVKVINVEQGDAVKEGDVLIVLQSEQMKWEEQEIKQKITQLEAKMAEEKQRNLEKFKIELEQQQAIYALQKKRMEEIRDQPGHEQALYELQIAMENKEAAMRILQDNISHPDASVVSYFLQIEEVKGRQRVLSEQMEAQTIKAYASGTVMSVEVLTGETVTPGKNLLWFENDKWLGEHRYLYGFFPLKSGEGIKPGMMVHMQFSSVNTSLYGKLEGTVTRVIPFTANAKGGILKSIPSEKLKEYLTHQEATFIIEVEPIPAKTASGFQWTTREGPPFRLGFGAIADVQVFVQQKRPITYFIPLKED